MCCDCCQESRSRWPLSSQHREWVVRTPDSVFTRTFTQASHDRGIKTWYVKETYLECLFCGKNYHFETYNVECHMDTIIGKVTGKERTVTTCKESISTSRGPHRNHFFGSFFTVWTPVKTQNKKNKKMTWDQVPWVGCPCDLVSEGRYRFRKTRTWTQLIKNIYCQFSWCRSRYELNILVSKVRYFST
jgi:hypothetical protein